MEHQPSSQPTQPINEPAPEVPHVLHPPEMTEVQLETPKVVPEVTTEQSPETHVSTMENEQEAEPKKLYKKVLRPGDLITNKLKERMRALALALVGLSFGGVASAEAGGIVGLKETAKVIGVGIVNETVLSRTPVGVVLDRQGNPVVVPKTPGQLVMIKPASLEPGIREHAATMGLNVIDDGMIFSISRNSDPSNNLSITKFFNPTWYTTSISLSKAPNGGIRLQNTFIRDGLPHTQMAIINIDTTGKMVTTIIGN